MRIIISVLGFLGFLVFLFSRFSPFSGFLVSVHLIVLATSRGFLV